MYSIDDLKTFVAIAEAEGVTPGAKRVGISPATASHRLRKLETALKLTLFHRNSRTLKLTPEGQIFMERTRAILADLMQAEQDAGSGTAELTGHLRVTMSPWILSRFLLPALSAFQDRHPGLTFEFLAVDRLVSLAAEGQDCAIRVGKLADSAMVARKLSDNARIICAAPTFLERHDLSGDVQDLLAAPWVCLPWQTRFAFRDAKGRRRDATVRSRVQVSNSDMLADAAREGLGLAVKSRLAIGKELEEGHLVEVAAGALWEAEAPIWFLYSQDARQAQKIQVFRDFVSGCFAAP
ncbi:MAG: LysR family transcriptional regulator [Pseudomonadota bacterium]